MGRIFLKIFDMPQLSRLFCYGKLCQALGMIEMVIIVCPYRLISHIYYSPDIIIRSKPKDKDPGKDTGTFKF